MAQLSKPPIPLKMYRHFAVVTVSVTALLAIFADGENRAAISENIDERQEQAALERASAERVGPPALVRRDTASQASFDYGSSEFDGSYGKPTLIAAAGATSAISPGSAGSGGDSERSLPGISRAYLDSLSEEEYLALVESLREQGMLGPQRQRQIAALDRASAQRSGGGGGGGGD